MKKIFIITAMLSVIISAVSCGEGELSSSAPPPRTTSAPVTSKSTDKELESSSSAPEIKPNDESSSRPDTSESSAPESSAPEISAPPPEESSSRPPESSANVKSEFNIGETWTVDGQWSLTVTGVTETSDRNHFSDKNPGAVYIIDYTYTNLGYESRFMDGLYLSPDDTIVDSAGMMGYRYPGRITYYPQQVPVGATCNAQTCVGVDNPGRFKVSIKNYDGNNKKQSATFCLVP